MVLELTQQEAEILQELVSNQVRALSSEIRHTDNPTFRGQLRERRDVLRGVCERLEGAPAA